MEKQQEQKEQSPQQQTQTEIRHETRSPARPLALAALNRETLNSGRRLEELSPTLLQELAALLGNSLMTQLLEGDEEGPETCSFSPPTDFGEPDDANPIQTRAPLLSPLRLRDGPGRHPAACAPRRIRERDGSHVFPGSFGMR